MTHICPHCNEPFEGRPNQVYCCRSHAEMYLRAHSRDRQPRKISLNMTGKCLQCGADVKIPRRFCCDLCGKRFRQEIYKAKGYIKKPRKKKGCGCGKFKTCMKCRNAERERAFRAGDIPVYRLQIIAQIVTAGD